MENDNSIAVMPVQIEAQFILQALVQALVRQPGVDAQKLQTDLTDYLGHLERMHLKQHQQKSGQLCSSIQRLLATGVQLQAEQRNSRDKIEARIADALRAEQPMS